MQFMENKKLIHSNEYHMLKQSDIQKEMKQVVDNLHMAAGSVVGFDLYKVVETYMLDLEKRHEINELLHIAEDASFYKE